MLIHRLLYIGRWQCDFYMAKGRFDPSSVMECLEDMGAPDMVLETSWYKMQPGVSNEGFTWSDKRLMRSCIFIGPTDGGDEFIDTLVHELRHLADDIATFLGIDLHGERVAYMTGDAARDLADVICRMGCSECNG